VGDPRTPSSSVAYQDDGKAAAEARRGDEERSDERAPTGRQAGGVGQEGGRAATATPSDQPVVIRGEGDQTGPASPSPEPSPEGTPDATPVDPTPDEPAADRATYESPTWGYVLTYDPAVWEVTDESSEGGVDRFQLYNGPSFVSLWGMPGYQGDPVACRDDWVRLLRNIEGVEDFSPLVDQNGDPLAGQDETSAFAVFTYRSTDGQEVFDVRCQTLVAGVGNLVVVFETFADQYVPQAAAVGELLTGLDLSGVREPDPAELTGGATEVEVGEARRPEDEDVDQIVIVDTFNDPSKGRLSTVSPDPTLVRYAYEEGEYVIETLDPDAGVWQAGIEGVYEDVALAIDVRLVGETAGRVIVLGCRYGVTDGVTAGYALLADPGAGTVELIRFDGDAVALVEPVTSEAFLPPTEQNRLELSCVGSTIKATVNGQVVATVEDEGYAGGYLFVGAGTVDRPGTIEARFDNLLITIFAA
jgi:hypothetical protein